jgi:hypothetical protein
MTAGTMGNSNVMNDPVYRQCIAAAIRAAAPQMEFVQDHLKLLAIATELEGGND